MRWRWTRRDYTGWIEMWGRTGGTLWSEMTRSRVWIQGMGKHVMFREPNCCIRLCLCNILYCIVKSFSLIHGRRHGWPNHIKTSCTICVIVLSLYSWTNIVGIKAFAGKTTISIIIESCLVKKSSTLLITIVLFNRFFFI